MTDKSIGAAINEVTEDDVSANDETTEETTETPADDAADEVDAADGEASEDEADSEEDEDADEDEDEEEEESSPFEGLTPDQLKVIKASPEMLAAYKGLMKSYTKKTQMASEALRLTDAYRRDPVGVLTAIAKANGYEIAKPSAAPPPPDPARQAIESAGADLEKLFGEKIGPQVRGVFEKWFDARAGNYISPLKDTLGRVVSQGEASRMMSEEQAFKVRHRGRLTPEVEQQVVELGNSGLIVPGENMTPSQYLDTLMEVVLARQARKEARTAKSSASKRLAARISKNASDREPSGTSGRGGVKKVSKIADARSISEALDMAARELDEESA